MPKNVELWDGDILIRNGVGDRRGAAAIRLQLPSDQALLVNVNPYGPGDNQRSVNVIWEQGPRLKDPSMSIGFVILDPIYKTLTGAHGEDLTRR